ncbi:MAG: metal-binding protein [Lachnospiraceae bacterium]|nr:metal-binding protein [Lachnospiraceae bacterium]
MADEKYVNGSGYFENRDCKYYPCHKGTEHINCMFCYCPFYAKTDCPGNPAYKEKNGRMIKSCIGCRFPHEYDNIDIINRMIAESFE